MLWRVIEADVVPTCEELGIGQIVWSPIAQGVLTGVLLSGIFFAWKISQIFRVTSSQSADGHERTYTVYGQVFDRPCWTAGHLGVLAGCAAGVGCAAVSATCAGRASWGATGW